MVAVPSLFRCKYSLFRSLGNCLVETGGNSGLLTVGKRAFRRKIANFPVFSLFNREFGLRETGSLGTGSSATLSHCFRCALYLSGWIRNGPEFPWLWGRHISQRGRQRPLSDRRYAAKAALISVRDCCSTERKICDRAGQQRMKRSCREPAKVSDQDRLEASASRGCRGCVPEKSGEAEGAALRRPG